MQQETVAHQVHEDHKDRAMIKESPEQMDKMEMMEIPELLVNQDHRFVRSFCNPSPNHNWCYTG